MASEICVIYARYSSHAQNDASIEQQVAECREYAAAHDLKISGIYADRAVSGRSDRRPEFQKMIRHAETGRFQVVLTYKSNRIARNMLDALRYEERLEKAGVKVIYCKENFGDNAAGRLALRMMMSLNEFYSENMAEDIRRGMDDNARQCKVNGLVPLGYVRAPDGRYAIDERSAAVVREIFTRVAKGEALASIADDLNRRAIRTGGGRAWTRGSFSALLSNERYIGVYRFGNIRIENGIPPIIDRALYESVQQKVKMRKEVAGRRRFDVEYLLTGKAFCAKCGAPMIGVSGTSRNGAMHYYYVCKTKHDSRACRKANLRKDAAELRVARELQMRVLSPEVIDWLIENVMRYQKAASDQSDLAAYQDRLVEVRKALDNIMKAIEAGIFSDTTKARLDALEAEQRELNSMIAMERSKLSTVTRDQIRYYLESFRAGDISDPAFRRRLIKTFLIKAWFDDDKFRLLFNYTDTPTPIDIDLSLEDIEEAECSYSVELGPPEPADTNTWMIGMIGNVFVLCVYDTIT